jgi:hypothetical protein
LATLNHYRFCSRNLATLGSKPKGPHHARKSLASEGFDAWSLGVEASTVIGLRLLKIGSGGHAAEAEARQMISEKIESGFALQSMAWSGRLGHNAHDATRKTLAHYRIKMRANRRPLAKG